MAEPVAGAALGACVPPDDYWPAVAEVCRRHGVLVVADEVMTGFGRTGRWFASDWFGLRPDLLTLAKGAASGYWPLGLAVASGEVASTIAGGGFTHGFTYSHHVVGAAAGRAVLRYLQRARAGRDGADPRGPAGRGAGCPARGPPRTSATSAGSACCSGVELVADRGTRAPFARAERVVERVVDAARGRGVLLYSSSGGADGTDGDLLLLGPPLVVTPEQVDELAAGVADAVADVLG